MSTRRSIHAWPLLFVFAAFPAAAEVVVRTANHDGFGRVVFELDHVARFTSQQDRDRLLLTFEDEAAIPDGNRVPRNVLAITGGMGRAELTLRPGATAKATRQGSRVVVDVRGPPTTRMVAAQVPKQPETVGRGPGRDMPRGPTPAPLPPSATLIPTERPAPVTAVPVPGEAPAPVIVQALAEPAPAAQLASAAEFIAPPPSRPATVAAQVLAAGPVSTRATLVAGARNAALLPFAADTGAAVLSRPDGTFVVFDERRALDLSALAADPVLGSAELRLLPEGSVLRLPPTPSVGVSRAKEGWVLSVEDEALVPVELVASPERVLLPLLQPGRVVAVPDPATGGLLLVGTQRGGPAQGLAASRRLPGALLPATRRGVVVEATSDQFTLRARSDGFALENGGSRLPVSNTLPGSAALADAATLTRRFDLSPAGDDVLLHRVQADVAAIASVPAQARFAPRIRAAQGLLALGMGAEAASLVAAARAEDPRRADDADALALGAAAALLAGRMDEAAALDLPVLDGSDEIQLWRGVRDALLRRPEAGARLAPVVALALSYPAPLRTRLLPPVAEALAAGGPAAMAASLLARFPDDPTLAPARAVLLERQGPPGAALAAWEALVQGADRKVRPQAALRVAELRVATGQATPAMAADGLERLFAAWRGDATERALRLRTAELRSQAGQWRAALSLLAETEGLFPADQPMIRDRMRGVVRAMLDGNPSALDLASVIGDFAAVIPGGAEGDQTARTLADRLVRLDLPERATPLLDRMMRAAARGPGRAELGLQLATLRLDEGDVAGAFTALQASDASGLPSGLAAERTMVQADCTARQGDVQGALALYATLDTSASLERRADLLEARGDWPGTLAVLNRLVDHTLPATGALDATQQGLLLRRAAAAAQVADPTQLRTLATQVSRMTDGRGNALRLLLSEPVRSASDLPRAAGDMVLARAMQASHVP